MTDKQKYAIKLAINTMNKHFGRHYNTVYGNRETGISVGYGKAINILSDMLSNADSHTCNCQHNSNSRENEPCCRCDSITANINKAKVNSLEIIARMLDNKPYYELKYRQVGKKNYSIGYSSYDLKIVLGYIDEYFEIVESDKRTNADRIRNMSDEELAEWLTNMCDIERHEEPFKSIYNLDTEQEEEIHDSYGDLLNWLQSEAE